ncbi:VOC family protein [Hoeflea sp. CAU 1731]
MTDKILAIDHLMIHVADSEQAGAVFERLGFVVTPKSDLPGLSNRLICFGDTPYERGVCNYIELMSLDDAAIAPPPMPRLLKEYGPVSTVLSVDDAHAVHARLIAEGIKIGPVLDLQRDWTLPDGSVVTPAFSVAIPELGQAPVYWNYCLHKTAQHYIRLEFTEHPNTALSFDEVYLAVDDPDAAAAHYVEHWLAQREGDRLLLPEGPALRLMSRDKIGAVLPVELVASDSPGIKAMGVTVNDLAKAQAVIRKTGVSTITLENGFAVKADDAAGCALLFEERHEPDR